MAILVPENFTRNKAGKVYKSGNALQKRKGYKFCTDVTDKIRQPKKLAAKRVKDAEAAYMIQRSEGIKAESQEIYKDWEAYNRRNPDKKLSFQQWNNKRTKKDKYAHLSKATY